MRLKSLRLVFDIFEFAGSITVVYYFVLFFSTETFFVHMEPTSVALILWVIRSNARQEILSCLQGSIACALGLVGFCLEFGSTWLQC